MNKTIISSLIYFILFILSFVKCQTNPLNSNDYNCYKQLVQNAGDISIYKDAGTYIDFCEKSGALTCNGLNPKIITSIYFDQTNKSYKLTYNDFSCFPSLMYVTFSNCNFSSSLIQQTYNNKISALLFQGCITDYENLFTTPINTNLTEINFRNLLYTPYLIQIKLSNIKTLTNFIFDGSNTINNITIINDLPTDSITNIPSLDISNSNNIPNLSNAKGPYLTFSFSQYWSDIANVVTYSKFKSLSIRFTSSVGYTSGYPPFDLIPIDNIIESLSFNGRLQSNQKLDLRNLKLLRLLNFRDVSGLEVDGKEIPFIFTDNLTDFTISGANIQNNIDQFFKSYPNITSVSISYNSISMDFNNFKNSNNFTKMLINNNRLNGTVDSSWCTTTIDLSNNLLSGFLPTCFACHINSTSVKNSMLGNSFTNLNQPCTTLIPNLYWDNSTKLLSLYGEDLGLFDSDISALPQIYFYRIIPSKLFQYSVTLVGDPIYNITFLAPGLTFTMAPIPRVPTVTFVTPTYSSFGEFKFTGSYFNNNKFAINVDIGGFICNIIKVSFYEFTCVISDSVYDPNSIGPVIANVHVTIPIISKVYSTKLTMYLNQTSPQVSCPLNCDNCNTLTGLCIIDKTCPNNCSGENDGGECNPLTGICICKDNRIFNDCSGFNCSSTCLHGSNCDTTKGICINCPSNYTGEFCSIALHYIVSITPCSINGGQVLLYGWFGDNSTLTLSSFTVLIGTEICQITNINERLITCNLNAGIGTKNIKITNNQFPNIIFNGIGLFNYYNPIKSCPNDCTNNGNCNTTTGDCKCFDQYTNFDCSTKKQIIESSSTPPTNITIDTNNGETSIQNQDTIYEISIITLNEISIDGTIIIKHNLLNNWKFNNTNNNGIFSFYQYISNNTESTISYIIEEIKDQDKQFKFGEYDFIVPKDSLKITVSIDNYQYQNSLNSLQLLFYSAVDSNNNNNNDNNQCNEKETNIDTSNLNNQQLSNYIQISKNNKILVGRFINQVVSDNRITYMSSNVISSSNDNDNNGKFSKDSILIGLNLPHCSKCTIDPDFSVLVSPDFKANCDNGGRKSWVLPVAIVVPVVFCSIIAIVSIIIYRKNRLKLKLMTLKLKSFRK